MSAEVLFLRGSIVVVVCVNGLAKICSMCGVENREAANYCLMCGSSVVVPPYQAPNKSFCYFHPEVMAQVYCSECGAPICLTCARYGVQSVFCSTCHQRRFHSTMGPIVVGPGPWMTYPMIPIIRHQRGYFAKRITSP